MMTDAQEEAYDAKVELLKNHPRYYWVPEVYMYAVCGYAVSPDENLGYTIHPIIAEPGSPKGSRAQNIGLKVGAAATPDEVIKAIESFSKTYEQLMKDIG